MISSACSCVSLAFVAIACVVLPGDGFVARSPAPLMRQAFRHQAAGRSRLTTAAASDRRTKMMAGDLDETKGVTVDLAEYKGGAVTVRVPLIAITEAQARTEEQTPRTTMLQYFPPSALQKSKKPYRLVPVRFVEEGGTKMGHTVIMNWDAKVDGRPVPGAKKENFELEFKEGHPEPWATFATKMAVGMGQMETKVFPATFPEDFEIEGLRGKQALVQAVVKNIARKEVKEPETRSDDEIRAALRVKGEQTVKSRTDKAVDEAVKKFLLSSCNVNADKVLNAVSWAKFGEQSTLDFKWNCIKEKIAVAEGIEPRAVVEFLRNEAEVILMEK
ncbi:unnamed protein product [Ectocarpus sp. 12 AP-2014]